MRKEKRKRIVKNRFGAGEWGCIKGRELGDDYRFLALVASWLPRPLTRQRNTGEGIRLKEKMLSKTNKSMSKIMFYLPPSYSYQYLNCTSLVKYLSTNLYMRG